MEINNIICRLAKEVRDSNNGVNDWNKVKHLVFLETGTHKSTDALRKIVKRYTKRFLGELPEEVVEKVVKHTKEVIELKEDGSTISEKMIKLSQSDLKSRDFLLTAHGFNPNEFELLSATNNFWGNELYQSKIKVRSLSDKGELSRQDILDMVKDIKPLDFKIELKPYFDGEKFALEIDLADIHIGALSWGEEVGEDNDYKITFENIRRVLEKMVRKIYELPIEKLYLCFLGDFLHIDTEAGTTTKGTNLDFDSRPKKMVKKGTEIVIEIIDKLAIVPTEVYWVEGNHSRNIEFAVFNSMPYIFAKVPHIKFDVSPRERKAFVYGKNLVGLEHGEVSKQNEFNWLQVEFRVEWGLTEYSEQHSGHLHHESVKTKGGIIKRSNPSLKPIDKYEYGEGYHSFKRVIGYLWHKEDNLTEQYFFK